ncbi:class I SAM-dependent methyltransferase family protein [Candidatus Bathyarchaeota archaeon]|nr:class I SAM-dependent methyltransferase family protein [Candidatus Bathyarchaeota archaeon]
MQKEAPCLKVPKINGEKAITTAHKLGLVNKELEVQRDNNCIYIPLAKSPSQDEIQVLQKQAINLEITKYTFPERKTRLKTLTELLEDKLPPHLLACVPRAMDIIGDIAIIEIPPELEAYKTEIGNAVLQVHKNLRTVLAKAGAVKGEYRTRKYMTIAGEPKTRTIHKEHGCQYHIDLSKAYFSPRLSHEHKRVASMVREGETVIDMFAGVGPFSILIAKTHEHVKVYAIDINPEAIVLLEKNIRLNRVEGKVHPVLGDAKQIIKQKLRGQADRVIMNLPEKAIEFVGAACKALKPEGGTIHFYGFVTVEEPLERLEQRFREEVEKSGRSVVKIFSSRTVRETAPYEWQAVLDAEIR